jgi:hypothetical protein
MTHVQLRVGRVGIQLHIPIEIVTPAVRCVPNPNGNGHNWIPARLHRLLHQLHAGFFRRATAFFVVTAPTGRHNIFPGLSSPLGDGNDMIEGQFLGPELVTTVLAGIPISRKDIDAGEFDRPMNVLEPDQLQEAHDGGKLDGNRYRMDLSVVDLEDFNFALPEECNRLLPMNNPQGLVCRVEQKGHFHTATSSQPKIPCIRDPGVVLEGLAISMP